MTIPSHITAHGQRIFADGYFWLGLLPAAFILSLELWYGFGMDQSFFAYAGWLWEHYHLQPYVGAWDINFPGVFVIYRMALTVFGDSILGVHIFDLLAQLACLPMLFYLARKLSGLSLAGSLAMVFYSVFYYGGGAINIAQRETFTFCFLLASLTAAFALADRVWLRAILSGLLAGFAFMVKPTYGLAWLVFGLLFLSQSIKSRPKFVLPELMVFGFSCLFPSVVTILFYWRIGHLNDLYLCTIWFNFKIYSVNGSSNIRGFKLILAIAKLVLTDQVAILCPAIFGIAVCAAGKNKTTGSLFWTLLGLVVTGLVSYRIQNKFFAYHLFPFHGFMIIFAGAGIATLASWAGKIKPAALGKSVSALIAAASIGLLAWMLDPGRVWYALHYSFRPLDKVYSLALGPADDPHHIADQYLAAQYLKPLISRGDQIEFFGPDPLIQFLLQTRVPSRFFCAQHFLFLPADNRLTSWQDKWMDEYTLSVMHSRPRFFILANNFPGQHNDFMNLSYRSLKEALAGLFPDLSALVNENYFLLAKIGGLEIYELKIYAHRK
jgi:hypothetical protein